MNRKLNKLSQTTVILMIACCIWHWATFAQAQYALPKLKVRGKSIRQPSLTQINRNEIPFQATDQSNANRNNIKSIADPLPSAKLIPLQPEQGQTSPNNPQYQLVPTNQPSQAYMGGEIPYSQEGVLLQQIPGCNLGCRLGPIFRAFNIFGPKPYRYTGKGQPLENGSWLNRPLSFSFNLGVMAGDTVIAGNVDQRTDIFGDIRVGWDFDHYWGTEVRLGYVEMGLQELGTLQTLDKADMYLWDVHVLYYPWGDSRWRPYMSLGLGATFYDFDDNLGRRIVATPFTLPFGFGIKCRVKPGFIIRTEVKNNLAFGTGAVQTLNNVSVTVGAEIRFGTRQRSYWPWNTDASGY